MADLIILEHAQRELEEIAELHLRLVGVNSARSITDLIYRTLERLELFPLSGHIPKDKELRNGGYRYVIAGKYICVYRVIAETVYVYHCSWSKQLSKPFQRTSEKPKRLKTPIRKERRFFIDGGG